MPLSTAHKRNALGLAFLSQKGGVGVAVMLIWLVPYLVEYSRVSRVPPLAILMHCQGQLRLSHRCQEVHKRHSQYCCQQIMGPPEQCQPQFTSTERHLCTRCAARISQIASWLCTAKQYVAKTASLLLIAIAHNT